MGNSNFLDQNGLGYIWNKIIDAIMVSATATEAKIPKNVSAFENDAKYITLSEVPEGVSASTTVPKVDDGSGSVGEENAFARGDHVHPTDTTRLAADGGDASKVVVNFELPKTRTQIVSGESFETIAGKILKYMNDFGTCAFKSMILKDDLAPSVKASLDKADSALQSFTESDPTVPTWAKQPTKPTYTAFEVGAVSQDYADETYAKKSDITTIYRPKGSVATFDDLPKSGNEVGDVWDVKEDGMNYAWTVDGAWDNLGAKFTITPISNDEIDKIVAGT